jgi:hypothetical protein
MAPRIARRTRTPVLAAAIALLTGARAALADDVAAARPTSTLVERAHLVSVELHHGHARLVVSRTVESGGRLPDQAAFSIALPGGAAATGLRTLRRSQWFAADLTEARAAAARYAVLTGVADHDPRDAALLSWKSQELLRLQLFPVPPGEQRTVEYTLTMPTEYHGGHDHLALPPMGTAALPAESTVIAANPGDRLFVDGIPAVPGARIKPAGDDTKDFALARSSARPLDGALAVVPFGKERVLVGQRVEAAPRLAEVPHGARIAVLLDASRSLGEAEIAAEIAGAGAYLAHFPDAQAEALLFDRRVLSLHGGFVPARQLADELAHLVVARRNGSRLDEAFARAAALFAGAPAQAPRRIVVLTDARMRAALTPERLRALAAASPGAVVHVGVIEIGKPELERDDDHRWAKVTRPSGGLVWRARASTDAGDATKMREVYEEWARPRHIDRLRFTTPGGDLAVSYPARLDEGEGFTDTRITGKQPGWLKVEGELWSRPISTVLLPDEAEGRTQAALVFGSSLLSQLTEPEMAALARVGRAVSPVTSYLTASPGVRPMAEGLVAEDRIGDAFGVGGLGLMGIGEGGGFSSSHFDAERALVNALEPGWKACTRGAAHTAAVTFETTFPEVVDVRGVKVDGSSAGPLARCLEEAAWEITLPEGFSPGDGTFDVAL